MANETISVAEAARRMGVSPSTVYKGLAAGTIPGVRVGPKRYVIPREAFDRMMAGHTQMVDIEEIVRRTLLELGEQLIFMCNEDRPVKLRLVK